MNVYPIMLKVKGRRAVVVGGGPVAMRKARALTEAGARVTVVAEKLAAEADLGGVDVIRQRYRPEVLPGAMLVFACTNDRALNARIAEDARRAGAIVNCADQPGDCDFFAPAVVSDGQVVVAIGTGGAAPALAGHLKEQIARAMPERIGDFAAALGRMREKVKARVGDARRRGKIMKHLAAAESYEAFRKDGQQGLARILDELTA